MFTISFHTDKTTSIAHNNRENIYGNKNIQKDKIQDNITYVKRDIQNVYEEIFGEAVDEYNAKQKRKDRKIDNYYKKCLHDKKTEHQRELIVAIGKADENTNSNIVERKKEVLDRYVKEFQEFNPNLIVYNCVMHLDEKNPHLHINYVPVASYSKGLKKRVAFEKALEQQGRNFEQWREKETMRIEWLMATKGLVREKKGSHEHMSVQEYKEYAEELSKVKKELEEKRKELKDLNEEYEYVVKTIKKNNLELYAISRIEERSKEIKKGLLDFDEKEYVKVEVKDFRSLCSSARKAYEQHNLYATVSKKIDQQEFLIRNYEEKIKELHKNAYEERCELNIKNDKLLNEVIELEENVKDRDDFIEEVSNYINYIDKVDECNIFIEQQRELKRIEEERKKRMKEKNYSYSNDRGGYSL